VRGLVAGRSQQQLGILAQPAAGVAQDQPANQLAMVGPEVWAICPPVERPITSTGPSSRPSTQRA
jgi:hypothetical protein